MGGPFLWTEHATVRVHGVDLPAGRVDAEHDGYRRLPTPVTHRRVVDAPPDDDVVLVVDVLTGDGAEACPTRTTWPLHPDLAVDDGTDGDTTVVARRDGQPVLRIVTAATAPLTGWRLYGGDEGAGELGWWSDRLEARRPCWFVGAQVAPDAGPVIVATLLAAGGDRARRRPGDRDRCRRHGPRAVERHLGPAGDGRRCPLQGRGAHRGIRERPPGPDRMGCHVRAGRGAAGSSGPGVPTVMTGP